MAISIVVAVLPANRARSERPLVSASTTMGSTTTKSAVTVHSGSRDRRCGAIHPVRMLLGNNMLRFVNDFFSQHMASALLQADQSPSCPIKHSAIRLYTALRGEPLAFVQKSV